jgi:hypothetical protein
MTTATGQYAINFGAPLADQNPWVDAAWTKRSGGTDRIASGLLRPNVTAFYSYTGATYSGSSITIGIEVNAAATDDEVVGYITDSSGNGFGIQIASTIVVVTVLTAWVVTDSVGTAAITLGTNDLFTFQVTKGTPNTVAVTRNGSTLTLSIDLLFLAAKPTRRRVVSESRKRRFKRDQVLRNCQRPIWWFHRHCNTRCGCSNACWSRSNSECFHQRSHP